MSRSRRIAVSSSRDCRENVRRIRMLLPREDRMSWGTKVLAAAVVLAAAACTAVVFAQDRRGTDDRDNRTQPPDRKAPDDRGNPGARPMGPMGPMGDRGQPKPDAALEAWVKTLTEKITDPHDMIRESARGALVQIGPPAMPQLHRIAEGDDAAKALAA